MVACFRLQCIFFRGQTTICQAAFENITKVFVAPLTSFNVLKKNFQKFKSTIIISTELSTKKKSLLALQSPDN